MRLILLSLIFASSAFAQTPDWRPINRVYKSDGQTIGSVGSTGQIKAGHVLTAKSFPVAIATDNTKLAYFNLSANGNDALLTHNFTNGTSAAGCTAGGTVSWPGANGTHGTNGAGVFVGASGNSLCSTDAFFNPGNGKSLAFGGWFSLTSWATGASQILMGGSYGAGDYSIGTYVDGTGILYFQGTNTAGSIDTTISYTTGFSAGSWHHIVYLFDYPNTTLKMYVDGSLVTSGKLANIRATTTNNIFRIGTSNWTQGLYMTGKIQDFFFVNNYTLSDQDIRRIYSARLDHNKNLIAKRQDWHFKHQHLGTAGSPYQTLPFVWHDPTDANSLFVDFSDLDATDKVDIRMYDLQQ